jgi:hypothetical protein
MSTARRLFDARPRDRAEAWDIARQWWRHATPEALLAIIDLAFSFGEQREPEPEVPVVVTKIASGRLVEDLGRSKEN